MDHAKYEKHYSEAGFFRKLRNHARTLGVKVIYSGLLLYYAWKSPNTPSKSKAIIIGALGYFILPFDLVLDALPAVGFTDDLGVLLFALAQVAMNIDDGMKEQAKAKLKDFFGESVLSGNDVAEVETEMVVPQQNGQPNDAADDKTSPPT